MTGVPTGPDDRLPEDADGPERDTARMDGYAKDGTDRRDGSQQHDGATGTGGSTESGNGRRPVGGILDRSVAGQTNGPGSPPRDPAGIRVSAVEESARSDWNDLVRRSPHGTPFHRFEFLEAIERHADADLLALVGRDDGDPVGLFPLFDWRPPGPATVAVSPPPGMGLYSLGPVAPGDDATDSSRRRNWQFVEACLDWLGEERGPWYVHVETGHRYTDVRPFARRGYDVRPRHTYLVDLARDEEDLFMAFSSDARRNVRECRDADCTVRLGGTGDLPDVIANVNERYAEQGVAFSLDPAFVTDLSYSMPDGLVRPYVVEVDGEFAGGMVALEFQDSIYRWQGGTVPDVDLPVNDYLDWRIMRDAMDRDLRWYDLVGANTERLCEYKAKFDPELATYYRITGGNRVVRAGVRLFEGSGLLDGRMGRLRRALTSR